MSWTRRRVLQASAAAALLGCHGAPPPVAAPPPAGVDLRPILEGPPDLLAPGLAAELASGLTLDDLALQLATFALQRCDTRSADGSGTVSHALLGVLPARRLGDRLPSERAAIPLMHVAHWVAREARRSPYHDGVFTLPAPAAAPADATRFADTIQSGDVDAADAIGAALAADPAAAARALLPFARTFGHGGHGALLLDAAVQWHRRSPEAGFLRAPVRYLASVACPPAHGGTPPDVDRAFGLLAARPATPLFGEGHLASSLVALRRLDPGADASWVVDAEAGQLGFSALEPEAAPLPATTPLPALVERAAVGAQTSVLHSIKFVDAALVQADSAPARRRDALGFAERVVQQMHSASSWEAPILDALGLAPLPR